MSDAVFQGKLLDHWIRLLRRNESLPAGAFEAFRTSPQFFKAALTHVDPQVRRQAASSLVAFEDGFEHRIVLERDPALADLLKDAELCQIAMAALHNIGNQAEVAVPSLVRLLEDGTRSEELRSEAAWALEGIRPQDQTTIAALIRVLHATGPRIREAAISALGSIGSAAGEAIPALISLSSAEAASTRCRALSALACIDPEGTVAIPLLAGGANDRDPDVRRTSVRSFGVFGGRPQDVVGPLSAALSDDDPGVRTHAALELGWLFVRMGEIPIEIECSLISRLKDCLRDEDGGVRKAASMCVANWEIRDREMLRIFHELARSACEEVRTNAVRGLANLDSIDDQTRRVLIEAANDAAESVRTMAVIGLRAHGARDRESLRAMSAALKDDSPSVRLAAAKGLIDVPEYSGAAGILLRKCRSDNESIGLLLAGLRDEVASIRRDAIHAVMSAGFLNASLEESLKGMLMDPENRLEAALALARLGSAEEGMASVFREGLTSPDVFARRVAAEGLARMAANPAPAAAELAQALSDQDREVRTWAVRALQRCRGQE